MKNKKDEIVRMSKLEYTFGRCNVNCDIETE